MRAHEGELRKHHLQVIVVTFEDEISARSYAEASSLPWPLLIDSNRDLFLNYGMASASLLDIWGPKTWWAYAKELIKGRKLNKSESDIYQRGGDVLIDPAGVIRFHHIAKGPADRPSADMILKKIKKQS